MKKIAKILSLYVSGIIVMILLNIVLFYFNVIPKININAIYDNIISTTILLLGFFIIIKSILSMWFKERNFTYKIYSHSDYLALNSQGDRNKSIKQELKEYIAEEYTKIKKYFKYNYRLFIIKCLFTVICFSFISIYLMTISEIVYSISTSIYFEKLNVDNISLVNVLLVFCIPKLYLCADKKSKVINDIRFRYILLSSSLGILSVICFDLSYNSFLINIIVILVYISLIDFSAYYWKKRKLKRQVKNVLVFNVGSTTIEIDIKDLFNHLNISVDEDKYNSIELYELRKDSIKYQK